MADDRKENGLKAHASDQVGHDEMQRGESGETLPQLALDPDEQTHSSRLDRLRDLEHSLLSPQAVLENPEFAIQLFESSPDAIIIVDDGGRIRLLNRQAELMFGYHRSELIGRRVEVLIPEDVRERHIRHRGRYAEEPRMRPMGTGHDLVALRKDGITFSVEINLSPIVTVSGGFVIATVRRKRAVAPT